jgi:tetratricopeptide (TPR) repeat protein
MNRTLHKQISEGLAVDRAEVLTLLQIALQSGEERFVRALAEDWLNAFPYDLPVESLRAKALLQEGKTQKALAILTRLTKLDPQFREAQELLAHVARRVQPDMAEGARAAAVVLSAPATAPDGIQTWAQHLIGAQNSLAAGDLQKAEAQVQSALMSQSPSPLPAMLHLQIAEAMQYSWLALHNLIELYSSQWPHTLYFKLMLADQLMESGEEDGAVSLLHECVAEDVTGQVARRLWGSEHAFIGLWPKQLQHAVEAPIPAKVAAAMGWNALESATSAKAVDPVEVQPAAAQLAPVATPKLNMDDEFSPMAEPEPKGESPFEIDPEPETPIDLEEMQTSTEDLRLRADGRFPAYVVLSTKAGLEKQYGKDNWAAIDKAMRAVASTTAAHPNWDAHLIYADEAAYTEKFGLEPAKADDAWAIKHVVRDLDEALRAKGEMIGALLIVGGPQVVPFHHLPNPVDDDDKDVPSDNPYASMDENYFVPTWPVGRLPGGANGDPNLLIKALETIAASRGSQAKSKSLREAIGRILAGFGIGRPQRKSFGYSAQIWRRASHSVYRTIGEPRKLAISPPTGSGMLPKDAGQKLEVAYFNLHGLQDAPEWYGQRDPIETPEGPDYPVALSPDDVINSGRAPQVVFSEACFGANVIGKNVESALSLKFLASGSKAVIGSTCTSYGSVTTPLIAADLLGQTFWKLMNEGHPVGEALRRAKIALAHAMHRRQGYLDGEDQKTLISFVLYGDPLAQAVSQGSVPKRIMRPDGAAPELETVCDRGDGQLTDPANLPQETIASVKSIVKDYLPGMVDSSLTFTHEHTECHGHDCHLPHHSHGKSSPGMAPNRQLVTLSKKVQNNQYVHNHYARITMNAQGKVVKLAVSR